MSEGDHDASRQPVSGLGERHHTPQKSEVTFQGPAPLLGLPTPGDRKSAWSKVTAAPTTCPSPGARAGSQVSLCQKRQSQEGSGRERPGQRLLQPCPWPASMAAVLGRQDEFCRAAFPLHWAPCKREDIRTAAAFMGEFAVSRGLAAARYLTCHKHRLKFLRIKAKVR